MKNIQRALGLMLLVSAAASTAFATIATPEIAPGTAGSALALVSGLALMIRGRRK
jgi:hypothetical protein